MTYADYTAPINPDTLKAAGIIGVCRYLSWPYWWAGSNHTFLNPKIIQKPEYDELVAAGIDVILNWEYDSKDWLSGAQGGGTAHGKQAVAMAQSLGYPHGKPIVGSADFDMTWTDWQANGNQYAQDFAREVLAGGYVPGVYGPYDVLTWVHMYRPEFQFFWQAGMSKAWSAGRNAKVSPYANLYQTGYMTIAGESTDKDIEIGVANVAQIDDVLKLLRIICENDNTLDPTTGKHNPIFSDVNKNADGSAVYLAAGNGVKQELDSLVSALGSAGISADQLANISQAVQAKIPTAADVASEIIKQLKA